MDGKRRMPPCPALSPESGLHSALRSETAAEAFPALTCCGPVGSALAPSALPPAPRVCCPPAGLWPSPAVASPLCPRASRCSSSAVPSCVSWAFSSSDLAPWVWARCVPALPGVHLAWACGCSCCPLTPGLVPRRSILLPGTPRCFESVLLCGLRRLASCAWWSAPPCPGPASSPQADVEALDGLT